MALNINLQDRRAEAETLYREALAMRRRVLGVGHVDTAQTMYNLAVNLTVQGRPAEAEPMAREAWDVLRRLRGDDHPQTVLCMRQLAESLSRQDKHAEAGPLFEQALNASRRRLGEQHPDTIQCLNSLAFHLHTQGKYAEAESVLERTSAICRQVHGEAHPLTARSLYNQAYSVLCQGKYDGAEAALLAAVRSFELARLAVGFTGVDRTAFGAARSPQPHLVACLAHNGKPLEAWQELEYYLARGLLDDFKTDKPQWTSEEQQQRQALIDRRQQLEREIRTLVSLPEARDTAKDKLHDLSRQRLALQDDLARLEAARSRRAVYDLSGVQAELPADAALLAWVDAPGVPRTASPEGEHWACVLRRVGPPAWIKLPGSGPQSAWTKDDDELPGGLRQSLSNSAKEYRELGRRLTAQRLTPVEPYLKSNAGLPAVRRLVVLPTGWIAGVPLEALTDRYTISYAPSATLFARQAKAARPTGPNIKKVPSTSLLALGDPVFIQSKFASLPGTRREVEALIPLFAESLVLLGSDASEQRLEELAAKDELRRYRYLHLATHGVIDDRRPKQSALILAQDHLPDPLEQARTGKRVQEGRLRMERILDTWKLEAELVTLSACETGLGAYGGGDGFLGFSQALFLAGARSLVLSLWPIDDTATALLMTRFYQNVLGKRKDLDAPLPKAEALREAKAWLRDLTAKDVESEVARLPQVRGSERTKPTSPARSAHPFEHPYYWSAFILIGDPN